MPPQYASHSAWQTDLCTFLSTTAIYAEVMFAVFAQCDLCIHLSKIYVIPWQFNEWFIYEEDCEWLYCGLWLMDEVLFFLCPRPELLPFVFFLFSLACFSLRTCPASVLLALPCFLSLPQPISSQPALPPVPCCFISSVCIEVLVSSLVLLYPMVQLVQSPLFVLLCVV